MLTKILGLLLITPILIWLVCLYIIAPLPISTILPVILLDVVFIASFIFGVYLLFK